MHVEVCGQEDSKPLVIDVPLSFFFLSERCPLLERDPPELRLRESIPQMPNRPEFTPVRQTASATGGASLGAAGGFASDGLPSGALAVNAWVIALTTAGRLLVCSQEPTSRTVSDGAS